MKYGYVYVGVSVAIVVIGIFLIYELGLKPETLQDKDELQHLQTTEMNDIYKPAVTEDQATQIIRSDLAKHLQNFDHAIIIGKDQIPNNPDYPKHPLRLISVLSNGTQLLINNTDYSVIAKCVPKVSYGWCLIHGESALQSSIGKLAYLADLQWYTTNTLDGFPTYYLIDAHNGDVLFSTLLLNINGTNETSEYRP